MARSKEKIIKNQVVNSNRRAKASKALQFRGSRKRRKRTTIHQDTQSSPVRADTQPAPVLIPVLTTEEFELFYVTDPGDAEGWYFLLFLIIFFTF